MKNQYFGHYFAPFRRIINIYWPSERKLRCAPFSNRLRVTTNINTDLTMTIKKQQKHMFDTRFYKKRRFQKCCPINHHSKMLNRSSFPSPGPIPGQYTPSDDQFGRFTWENSSKTFGAILNKLYIIYLYIYIYIYMSPCQNYVLKSWHL